MAIISAGYAGTVSDRQWARMSKYRGGAGVPSRSDFAATQSGSTRTINVAAGEAFGDGILDVSDAVVQLTPATPTNGQWFLLVARRSWAAGLTALQLLPSVTTSTTTPTAVPASDPASMLTDPGVQSDQALWWVWINSANTQMLLVDRRELAATVPRRGTATQRDAAFPATSDIQRAMYAGQRWFDTTLGRWATFRTDVPVPGWYLDPGRPSQLAARTELPVQSSTNGASRNNLSVDNTINFRGYIGNYGWLCRLMLDAYLQSTNAAAGYLALWDGSAAGVPNPGGSVSSPLQMGGRGGNNGSVGQQVFSSVDATVIIPPNTVLTFSEGAVHESGGAAFTTSTSKVYLTQEQL